VAAPATHRVRLPAGIHVAAGIGAFQSRFDAEAPNLCVAGAAITLLFLPEPSFVETSMETGLQRSVGLHAAPGSAPFAALEDLATISSAGRFTAGVWPISAASAFALAKPILRPSTAPGRLFAEARALELLGHLLAAQGHNASPASHANDRLAKAARAAIDADPSAVRSLWALAASLNSSPRALAKAFRITFGIGLAAYCAGSRLDQAHGAIREGASIEEAAALAGYSRAHFTVAFTRRFGRPPRDVLRG
jgi:AraC-like DNA-binding protein